MPPLNQPICMPAASSLPQEPATQAPAGSSIFRQLQAHYKELAQSGGVMNSAAQLELKLQADFVVSAANMSAAVPSLGKYNRIESNLAALLGWKRWIWQSSSEATSAGAVRMSLKERADTAGEMVRLLALNKAMPKIRQLQQDLKLAVNDTVSPVRLQELLYDEVVVGNYPKLQNVSDSPLLLEKISQRYIKHKENLDAAGLSEVAQEKLGMLSEEISHAFDEVRYAAGKAGFDIDLLENGGYFPIQATPEFDKFLRANQETWLEGYSGLKEMVQKSRKTNVPVVADLDHLAKLWSKQLTDVPLEGKSLLDYTAEEAAHLANQAHEVQVFSYKKRAEMDDVLLSKQRQAAVVIEKSYAKKAEVIRKRFKDDFKLQKQALVNKQKAPLPDGSLLTPFERKAQIAQLELDMQLKQDQAVAALKQKQATATEKATANLASTYERKTQEAIEAFTNSKGKDVQAALQLEQSKMKLLSLNSTPGGLSEFLGKFSDVQLKNLFEAGYLQQMPAMTDELLEFYRGVDVGVRGLADAMILDPEKALRNYADDLYKATVEHSLFKTAFDQGASAGWVVDTPPKGNASAYIRVGASPKLQKWLDDAGLAEGAADLYIHKTAADQLNGLLEINTSPHHLQGFAGAWNSFSSVFRKSLLLSGGLFGYIPRVFTQNVIAHFAATGSLHTLPMSIIDSMRVLSKGFDGLDSVKKLYTIGGKDYSVAELYKELLAQRGGSASSSMYEARGVADNIRGFFKDGAARERSKHFNALYQKRYGNPLTGAVQAAEGVANVAKAGFDSAYGVLSFSNQFLDNAFRWASFRELAASGKYSSIEDILRKLDNYYSINGDGGVVGNAIGSVAMPFANFAINAPGAAIRHALSHPWRAANVMRLYSLAQQDTSLTEAELPKHLRDSESYFMTIYRDPETGERGVIMPGGVDFMLDSYTWLARLANGLAGGNPKSVGAYVDGKLNSEKGLQDAFKALVAKSYVGNIGLSLAGVDPSTMESFDNLAPVDTLLGVPVSRSTRTLLTNLAPILKGLDKALPTALVGTPSTTSLDSLGFETTTPGTPGLFGATPTTGGTPRNKPFPGAIKAFQSLSGVNVSYIDPQRNILRTYKDFTTQASEIHKTRVNLYQKLTLEGVPKTAPEWQRFEQLKQMEVLLKLNKIRIDNMALERGIAPPELVEQLQGKFDNLLNAPLKDDVTLELIQELSNER